MTSPTHTLDALCPLDGRYYDKTSELRSYFSEEALMKNRCLVEIWYFIALSKEKGIKEFPKLSKDDEDDLWSLVPNFTTADSKRIKALEKKTNHDVKAIEYYLREEISKLPCKNYAHFLHFGLTSEDINNIAYTLMWREAIKDVYMPELMRVTATLKGLARAWADIPMLSLTHGQSATPTTVGKELSVFVRRLAKPIRQLQNLAYTAKLNGATGTWAAHALAYPKVDWIRFSKRFLQELGLEHAVQTKQIESSDTLAESFLILSRINTIFTDLTRDMWLYISRGIFKLEKMGSEIGSSTMPHKINPIHFENAEGNLSMANSLLFHLAGSLPVSRLQRDLSGSTLIRSMGIPLAQSLLACKNIGIGLSRIQPSSDVLKEELDAHWEVLAEAIQTLLRKEGYTNAYEHVKAFTRGISLDKHGYTSFVSKLPLSKNAKKRLMQLTPSTYIGLTKKIARLP